MAAPTLPKVVVGDTTLDLVDKLGISLRFQSFFSIEMKVGENVRSVTLNSKHTVLRRKWRVCSLNSESTDILRNHSYSKSKAC